MEITHFERNVLRIKIIQLKKTTV